MTQPPLKITVAPGKSKKYGAGGTSDSERLVPNTGTEVKSGNRQPVDDAAILARQRAAEITGMAPFQLSFPQDSGNYDNRSKHEMIIYITKNHLWNSTLGTEAEGIFRDAGHALGDGISVRQFASLFGGVVGVATSGLGEVFRRAVSGTGSYDQLNRRNKRINNMQNLAGQISFHMPNTVQFTNENEYRDISLTEMLKNGISAAASFTGAGPIVDPLFNVIEGASALAGYPINPKVEILFSNTPQRTFQFDFLFAPTTEKESTTLRDIIKAIRREAAPERKLFGGFFWKAPSTFDIVFFHNGEENENIPRIQECVLTQIDVDYAPSGVWSTFTNGYPTQVRLQLRFREREPNSRDSIEDGF